MKLKTFSICVMIIVFYNTIYAQKYYYQKQTGEEIDGGYALVLPQASFIIQIPVTTKKYKLGGALMTLDTIKKATSADRANIIKKLCSKYGANAKMYQKLLNDSTLITHSLNEDSIKVNMIASPDYSKTFYCTPKNKWNKNTTLAFTYNGNGTIGNIESSYEDKTYDIVVGTIGSVVGIVGNFLKSNQAAALDENESGLQIQELDNILEKLDNIQKFQTHNNDIYKDVKNTLTKKYAVAFAKYFYSSKTTIKVTKLIYTPQTKKGYQPCNNAYSDTITLVSFNTSKGLIAINTEIKNQIWGKNISDNKMTDTAYTIIFESLPEMYQNVCNYTQWASEPKRKAIPFNIPLKTKVTLKNPKGKAVYEGLHEIAQFGIVSYVQNSKNTTVTYNPLTGSISGFKTVNTAFMTDNIDKAATVIKDTKAIFEDDELGDLQYEKSKLELIRDIQNLQNEIY